MDGLEAVVNGGDAFLTTLALVGVVILVAALLSGVVERSRLPQVAVFLALGAALGPAGIGVLNVELDSPALRIIATLSLVLVLFTDALTVDLADVRRHAGLALVVLGPGTLLSAALIALAGWALLGLQPALAAILGAALASTDPVLLRGLLQGQRMSAAARQALRLESGLNDVVLLPIVLVAMAFLSHGAAVGATELAHLGVGLFLLGPGLGVAIGLVAVAALELVRRQVGVRRDYESLYSLGVAFSAYAAAEAVHGSGFLAAFAAGLTIASLDVELCDCFVEYGETTSEMALLLTFVLFGASLIWSGLGALDGATVLFAVVALLARPLVFVLALARTNLDRRGRLLVASFGPRGLSSLLLVLLPVFAGLPGGEQLFAICALVVLLSVAIHGGTPILLARLGSQPPSVGAPGALAVGDTVSPPSLPSTDGTTALPAPDRSPGDDDLAAPAAPRGGARITIDELRALWAEGAPVVLLDVRNERSYSHSDRQARGALRLPLERPAAAAAELGLPRDAWLVAYCT